MSIGDVTRAYQARSNRLNPAAGTSILRASVEAKRVSDLCTGAAAPDGARERILAWLADGAREVAWALCSFPRERWAEAPPDRLDTWPALRHARHLALREMYLTLPSVRHALGEACEELPSTADLEQADAAWDQAAAIETAEAIVRGLGETRFELLQRLEAAPDTAWERPLPLAVAPDSSGSPIQLDWLMLHARQHEMEHLAAIWRVALYWDRAAPAAVFGRLPDTAAASVPLHPADRLEEPH
ncbi:MAG: DinB family protein [Chloroflexota bacterium]